MHNPWTSTKWGLEGTKGKGVSGGRGAKGKNWDINSIINKIYFKNYPT